MLLTLNQTLIISMIIFSMGVIFVRNPLHAILFLNIVFLLNTLFFLNKQIQFITLIIFLIYVGAIIILFIYIILLLNIHDFIANKKISNFLFFCLQFKFFINLQAYILNNSTTVNKFALDYDFFNKNSLEPVVQVLYKTNDIWN